MTDVLVYFKKLKGQKFCHEVRYLDMTFNVLYQCSLNSLCRYHLPSTCKLWKVHNKQNLFLSIYRGMASVLGAPLSPEQTFGSIKSLAISREVASFPLSRSPTPPPLRLVPWLLNTLCRVRSAHNYR